MEIIKVFRTSNDVLFDKKIEIDELEKELKESELYKRLEQAKNELALIEKAREEEHNSIINYMIENNIKKIEEHGFRLSLKNNGRDSVKVLNLEEIPEEFLRIKKEADKKALLDYYRTTGVVVQGTEIERSEKYALELRNVNV